MHETTHVADTFIAYLPARHSLHQSLAEIWYVFGHQQRAGLSQFCIAQRKLKIRKQRKNIHIIDQK